MDQQVIHLHLEAPPKPPEGAACNGCGLCCAAEPCPLGMLLSRRRSGACVALQWDEGGRRYRCGALAEPQRFTRLRAPLLNRLFARWAARMIASGRGCDSNVLAEPG